MGNVSAGIAKQLLRPFRFRAESGCDSPGWSKAQARGADEINLPALKWWNFGGCSRRTVWRPFRP